MDRKNLYIYYISGTGNARLCSKWMGEEAEKEGWAPVIQSIDSKSGFKFPEAEEKAVIGFAYPTHGFNGAPMMLKFIAGFPRGNGNKFFLVNTRAGMKLYKMFLPGLSGVALYLPALMLIIKGYRFAGFRPVDMPSNWISLHPGIREKVIESIIRRCKPITKQYINRILDGKKVYRGLWDLPADLLISPIAAGYYLGGRFFLAKTFYASDKCNNCGVCMKECPTGSIILVNKRLYWKLTCESCMRCMNSCQRKAIETAHGMATLFMILILSTNSLVYITLSQWLGIVPEVWWWKVITQLIGIGILIVMSTILYYIMHLAAGFRIFNLLLRVTSFTSLPFWRRYSYLLKKKN
jgi:Pyruvate/2-oxoacid:ferredoxin oxidoreductase delta subunit